MNPRGLRGPPKQWSTFCILAFAIIDSRCLILSLNILINSILIKKGCRPRGGKEATLMSLLGGDFPSKLYLVFQKSSPF